MAKPRKIATATCESCGRDCSDYGKPVAYCWRCVGPPARTINKRDSYDDVESEESDDGKDT